MNKRAQSEARTNSVSCSVDHGVEVDICFPERILWVIAERLRLQVAIGLDDVVDAGYNVKSRTLGIALDAALGYVEIPCSRQQAENIFVKAGWDVTQMQMHKI